MKTKMKSAFAFIAVALMIMVAVVPMVSVFSDEADAAVAPSAAEYDNSVKTPIVISGKLLNADGTTAVANSKIVANIATGVGTGTYYGYTNASGEFAISITQEKGTALGDIVLTVDGNEVIMDATGAYIYNGAYGITFPTVTLKNVNSNESVNIIAGTVLVSGKLELKGSAVGVNVSTSIIGADGSVTSKADGTFSFYGVVGKTYTLTASAVGTTFAIGAAPANTYTVKASGNTEIVLKAADYLLYGTTTVPKFTLSAISAPATGTVASVTGLATPTFSTVTDASGNNTYYYYSKITYSTDASTLAFSTSTFDVNFEATSGITSQKTNSLPTLVRGTPVTGHADCNIAVSPSNLIKGSVAVGDSTYSVPIVPTSVLLTGTYNNGTTDVTITKTAIVYGGEWFVGTEEAYTPTGGTATTAALTVTNIVPTVSVTGYTFALATTSGVIYSNNHVLVSGSVDKFVGKTASIAYTATGAVPASPAVLSAKIGDVAEVKTYRFYVPAGTSVTVNAPSTEYAPNVYTNVNVQKEIVVPEFKCPSDLITYTGKITLNGTAVAPDTKENMIAVSYDSGITFVPADITVVGTAYKIKTTIPITKVKISQLYKGGYEFNTELKTAATSGKGYYYVPVSITTIGEIPNIAVKTTDAYVKIANYGFDDESAVALSDVKVKFYQSSSATSYGTELATVAEKTTDANGIAKATLAKPLVKTDLKAGDYRIYAVITDANGHVFTNTIGDKAAYLVTTFSDDELAATDVPITAKADAKKIFGYLKTESGIIGNVDYTYDVFAGDKFIGTDKGKTVDGRFDLAYPDNATDIKLYVSGYGADVTGAPVLFNATTAGQFDKDVKVIPTVEKEYKVSYEGSYYDYVNVTTGNYAKGKVITLSAASEFTVEDTENLYADGYTKYTFKAWYVNGKQISTDAITSYTVGDENIVVSTDYTSEHVTVADGKQKDDGVDSNVMIIGIAAVVVALIAVVYAVIQKKE
ncbi:hypothetical protein [Candidatus Methanarcanum hacksteinii]|uniref:hypothetical protein n=1 Tax=Candidatus Methanarcanum hacksteinii TaxID=2911857 RepID=UPI0037DCE407